jgi:GTP cyclohydrolase I
MNTDNDTFDEAGDDHFFNSVNNPIREDAFDLSDDQKIELIKKDVASILTTLGMDLTDDSMKGTPNRVAKMFVKELFGGLNPSKNQVHLLLKIIINMAKCLLKKTLRFIQHANIICCPLLEEHTWLISPAEK